VLALAAEAPLGPDQAFEQVKSYDYGQSDKALHFLELEIVRSATDAQKKAQMAERLGAILAEPKATQAAKVWCCQQLLLVGTEAQVPILVKMLDDEKTVEMARFTLEGIPGEASLAALRACLGKLWGKALVGAINSLGIRRDAKAVPALAAVLMLSSDSQLPAAAAEALGKIGTAEAAATLAKAQMGGKDRAMYNAALQDAQLRCGQLLAASGDATTAAALFQQIWTSNRPPAWRLEGLIGLAKVAKDKATPIAIENLSSEDPLFQATAVRLTRELPGQEVTAALVQRLDKLDANGQVLLLGILAERGDRAAAEAVAKRMDDKEPSVRVAAILAMGSLGDASSIERLARLAAGEQGAVQQAARTGLGRLAAADVDAKLLAAAPEAGAAARLRRLAAADVDAKLLAAAPEADPAVRPELIRALAARRTAGARALFLKAAADADDRIRTAALDALGVLADPDSYPAVVQLLVAAAATPSGQAAERAVLAVGSRLSTQADRAKPVVAALEKAPAEAKPSLLRVLAGFGGPEAFQAVQALLGDPDANIKEAAVRALAAWPDLNASGDLLKLARESDNATFRVLALRGYLRLAQGVKDGGARLKMLDQIRPIATTADSKKLLLAALGDGADAGALHVALSFLDDQEVQPEAIAAVLKVGKAVAHSDKPATLAAAKRLMELSKDKTVLDQAEALQQEALKPSPEVVQSKALQYDKQRSEAQKKELAKRNPKGYRLACYLDCGPDAQDGEKGGPTLRILDGQAYFWPQSDGAAVRFGTIFYTGSNVTFEATGLNPKKAYQLGFSWWDCDHDTRVQSVWLATAKGEKRTKAVDKTKLPSGQKKEPPAEKVIPIPSAVCADGAIKIDFVNESEPNCVVSEVWLLESEAEGAQGEAGAAGAVKEAKAADEPKGDQPGTKVLIVTGVDSAHNWKATMGPLADVLRKDPRLSVRIVEDPNFIASDELKNYDVIVIHFQNPKPLEKGVEGGKSLQKLIEEGKGLVIVHFGCGALREWPDFVKLAGRVWDPKLRAHDPRGPFKVNITDVKHPITDGMQAFDTDDELYTCLAGDVPIQVLATAVSKVDKKDYPMAFVLTVGKGRVFHCVLGHDAKAITFPGVAELFRRGTAWSAGLPPVAK
jgi:type 1 glutamine amidotransferase/HEAT repeat protein